MMFIKYILYMNTQAHAQTCRKDVHVLKKLKKSFLNKILYILFKYNNSNNYYINRMKHEKIITRKIVLIIRSYGKININS